jgi:hypothetical protein
MPAMIGSGRRGLAFRCTAPWRCARSSTAPVTARISGAVATRGLADSFAEELQRGYPAAHNPRRRIDPTGRRFWSLRRPHAERSRGGLKSHCAFAKSGSQQTRRWSKPDSNSRSHPLTRSRNLGGVGASGKDRRRHREARNAVCSRRITNCRHRTDWLKNDTCARSAAIPPRGVAGSRACHRCPHRPIPLAEVYRPFAAATPPSATKGRGRR